MSVQDDDSRPRSSASPGARRRREAIGALTVFTFSLGVYLYNADYRFWGAAGDTIPAQLLPLALERNGELVFDGLVSNKSMGHWFTQRQGHVVSAYPIVPGFFNVPTYFVASRSGRTLDGPERARLSMITASLVTAASAVFFFLAVSRIVTRLSTALGATFVYSFATTAGSVAARGLWQHGPSLLFLNASLWMLTHRGSRTWIGLAGLPLGLAIWNRPVNALLVAPLVLYVLAAERRSAVVFALALAAPMAAMSWYSWRYWGSITFLGQYSPAPYFGGRFIEGLLGLLVSPSRGLFVFTPLFLLSLPVAARALRDPRAQPLMAALALGPVLQLPLFAQWFYWWGGYTFGYRLLTEWVPALTLLIAVGWETHYSRSRLARASIATAGAWSLYVNLLGAFFYPCGFNSIPNDIDQHPERLWGIRDGEIWRCADKSVNQLRNGPD